MAFFNVHFDKIFVCKRDQDTVFSFFFLTSLNVEYEIDRLYTRFLLENNCHGTIFC